jgi:hypothetical protein
MAEDGTEQEIRIDPNATQAYFEDQKAESDAVKSIFNPSVGRYEVVADTGPGFATRRQEAFDAFVQIATKSPEIMKIAGDLMFKVADFDLSDELAERFRKLLPPEVTGEQPHLPPQVLQQQQKMQAVMERINKALSSALEENAKLKLELKGKSQQKDIDVYDAETRRISALQKQLPMDAQGIKRLVHQLVLEALQTTLGPVVDASAPDLREASEGAGEGAPQSMPLAPDLQPQQPQAVQ